ncbi:hypothetical protein Dimus_011426 [Dionaea muscipula]
MEEASNSSTSRKDNLVISPAAAGGGGRRIRFPCVFCRMVTTDLEMMEQEPLVLKASADKSIRGGSGRWRDVISPPATCGDGGVKPMMISLGLHGRILEGDVAGFLEANNGDSGLMELRGPGGDTVLHIAARAGRLELIAWILLEHNDLITTKNSKGDLPLHVAARAGQLDSVKYLVDWIVDCKDLHRGGHGITNQQPNLQEDQQASDRLGGVGIEMDLVAEVDGEGDTPLHIALENHNEDMAAYLVDRYPFASFYANRLQVSPLHLAIEAGYRELVQSMLARNPIGEEHVKNLLLQGKSVVHAAIRVKNGDLLATMLDSQPALMDTYDEEWRTPFAYAAFIGHIDAVRYFLDKFPDYVYKVDKDGSFPIHGAARGGRVRVMKELFSRFSSTRNLLNQQGQSILHMASKRGKADMVSYLLKIQDIDRLINLRDEDGNTALHLAVLGRHAKVVSIFTWDERVDLSLQNKLGMTALDIAEYYEDTLPTYEQRLAWLALRYANAPRARRPHGEHSFPVISEDKLNMNELLNKHGNPNPKPPNLDNYKDRVNTLLLVSTLVTTVTFTAGFTVPGGYSSSGKAIFADKPAFQAFVITDTIALYSSILAVVALIYGQLGDLRLILISLKFAVPFLGISLTMMSVAFMVGVYLLVNHIHWLSIVILVMGSIFLAFVLIFFIPLYSHSSIKRRFVRYIFYVPFQMMLLLVHASDTDKDSS